MKKDSTWIWIAAGVGLLAFGGGAVAVSSIIGGNLSPSQIATYAQNAGFTGNDLITAVAVAMSESGGNPNALGDTNIPQGPSYGLWQIDSYYHPEYGPDFTVLYDPQTNATAAYQVYVAAGFRFSPWSTYNGGQYQTYVAQVQSALGVA